MARLSRTAALVNEAKIVHRTNVAKVCLMALLKLLQTCSNEVRAGVRVNGERPSSASGQMIFFVRIYTFRSAQK